MELTALKQRQLGRNGPVISEIGLGCMGMSVFYTGFDDTESEKTLHRAAELGVTLFDTADMYGNGENEKLVGRALRGVRERIVLATKFGQTRKADGMPTVSGRPEYVHTACDASLQRLGVDVIDLYYQHRVDPNVPIEETVGAMADLVKAGKVRYLGLCEASAETVRRAHQVHPIAALQTEYSLWSRDPEVDLLPTLRELGIGFVPYSPLGRGFLTGQFNSVADIPEGDIRRAMPRFQEENIAHNTEIVKRLEVIATRKECSTGQLALAWVLAQGDDILPIPGTKRRTYLEQNIEATDVVLNEEDLVELDKLVPAGSAKGTRYPAALMGGLNL